MKKRYVALIASICVIIISLALFVGLFVHQVKASENFQVTVTKFGAVPIAGVPGDDSWKIHIEQLNHLELENPWIIIDTNNGQFFYGGYLNSTYDGRSQKEFCISWHPSNITIVWAEGCDYFYF